MYGRFLDMASIVLRPTNLWSVKHYNGYVHTEFYFLRYFNLEIEIWTHVYVYYVYTPTCCLFVYTPTCGLFVYTPTCCLFVYMPTCCLFCLYAHMSFILFIRPHVMSFIYLYARSGKGSVVAVKQA